MVGERLVWVIAVVLWLAVALVGPVSAQVTSEDLIVLQEEVGRLHEQGKFAEAIPIAERYVAAAKKRHGENHHEHALALIWLGFVYHAQGRYVEAEPLLKRSLGIGEKTLGLDHPDVGMALANLASLYQAQGRYAEAEPLFKRSLGIGEKALGPEHPEVGSALANLASLYKDQGRYADAEPLFKRSLAIRETALGREHPMVAASLNNLAELYREQGRYGEAEPLYKRSLALRETALGTEHPAIGTALNNLALLLRAQGRYAEAEPAYKRSIRIREKALGPKHPLVATSMDNLAVLYDVQGRYGEAEALFKRSLANRETALGREHPDVGNSLNNLALHYNAQGRFAEAEPLFKRSLGIGEKALGPEHPLVARSLNNLAWLALAQSDFAGAAEHWRRATTIFRRRTERGLGGWSGDTVNGEAQQHNWYFEGLVKTTHRLVTEDRGNLQALTREMFEMAQWGKGSEAAASLAHMAARSAGGSPALAARVRERQDLIAEWEMKDKLLIAAKSEPPSNRSADNEKALSERLTAINARLAEIDDRFAKDFPDYAALASPKPISVADVQASLRNGEALVLVLDTDGRFPNLPEETFVWVVTTTDVRWLRSDLGTAALTREVAALRCGLDAVAWAGDGAKRCGRLLGLAAGVTPGNGDPLPFDTARAHALYKSLLGEAADLIKGKHLLVVPSGPLTTLPFQVLVTAPATDMASARWLIRDHALTVLPSVAALKSLRRDAKPSKAAHPMIGFGNPLLDGDPADPKHGAEDKTRAKLARAHTGCAASAPQRTAALRGLARSLSPLPKSSGLASLDHLRIQTPLPETADELCQVVRAVGGRVEDVRLGATATEREVKRLSASGALAQYRMLHFATHGTLAGQLSGTTEPGLILTPPATATAEDDGYLSGSEIASLKLDADWVILSACNTAGGGAEGEAAEALSGLARVFFYAGARALLVSHWEVDSHAAVKLVTGGIGELAKDRSIGRAEALRRATLAAMTDTTRPAGWAPAWHPAVWAPFVVVGEGGGLPGLP